MIKIDVGDVAPCAREIAVGKRFAIVGDDELNGVYEAVAFDFKDVSSFCSNCAFHRRDGETDFCIGPEFLRCFKEGRSDGKSVTFKRVETNAGE